MNNFLGLFDYHFYMFEPRFRNFSLLFFISNKVRSHRYMIVPLKHFFSFLFVCLLSYASGIVISKSRQVGGVKYLVVLPAVQGNKVPGNEKRGSFTR